MALTTAQKKDYIEDLIVDYDTPSHKWAIRSPFLTTDWNDVINGGYT